MGRSHTPPSKARKRTRKAKALIEARKRRTPADGAPQLHASQHYEEEHSRTESQPNMSDGSEAKDPAVAGPSEHQPCTRPKDVWEHGGSSEGNPSAVKVVSPDRPRPPKEYEKAVTMIVDPPWVLEEFSIAVVQHSQECAFCDELVLEKKVHVGLITTLKYSCRKRPFCRYAHYIRT